MDIRQITPTYFVAPQIDSADMADLAAAGIKLIIANRPDSEVPSTHQADAMETAARAAGIEFVRLPLTHQTMTPEIVGQQSSLISEADGVVLAYCASGTRSTIAWALGEAQQGTLTTDEIMSAAQSGGYDLQNMQPTIDAMMGQRG
ncbi:MAG: TIGR01244 family sulfur transferase [Paracoccaceae bacterium]